MTNSEAPAAAVRCVLALCRQVSKGSAELVCLARRCRCVCGDIVCQSGSSEKGGIMLVPDAAVSASTMFYVETGVDYSRVKMTPFVVVPRNDQSPVNPFGSVVIFEIRAESTLIPRDVTLTLLAL